MSDSSLSNGSPSDATLEQALRHAIQQVYDSGRMEELTVKRIRVSAETDLDLPEDFFKNDPTWKERSKSLIQSEVNTHNEANSSQPASSQQAPQEIYPTLPKPQKPNRKAQGTKRAPAEKRGPKKRRKKNDSDKDDSASVKEEAPSEKPVTKIRERASTSSISPPPKEEADELASGPNGKSKTKSEKPEQSESELSELLDEEPKPKRRGKSGSAKPRAKKSETSKGKKAVEQPSDPDAEEIKRLQGWLVKCGIRKLWGKELAPYNTGKLKIRHLKEMLADAGMTGRYSDQKATQLKDERELKLDLEAVQEGNKQWGKAESEEEDGIGRPKRKLARGLEGLDFLNDDDGEETD